MQAVVILLLMILGACIVLGLLVSLVQLLLCCITPESRRETYEKFREMALQGTGANDVENFSARVAWRILDHSRIDWRIFPATACCGFILGFSSLYIIWDGMLNQFN